MIITSEFSPPWFLKNPHLQTLFTSIFSSYLPALSPYQIEDIELEDGDFCELIWPLKQHNPKRPLVILLHGLGGGVNSSYVSILFDALYRTGFRCVLMQFRGAGERANRLPRTYNACDTSDLNYVMNLLQQREPQTSKAIIGVSLGGNLLLKWLGEMGSRAKIDKAIAISVPYDIERLVKTLNTGFAKVYQKHLLDKLKKLYQKKPIELLPVSISILQKIQTIEEFDTLITAPLNGFKSVSDYYEKSGCVRYLKEIHTETLLIHAQDDPFMTPDCIPKHSYLSQNIHFELSDNGGHVGFITAEDRFKPGFWLAKRIPEFLMDLIAANC